MDWSDEVWRRAVLVEFVLSLLYKAAREQHARLRPSQGPPEASKRTGTPSRVAQAGTTPAAGAAGASMFLGQVAVERLRKALLEASSSEAAAAPESQAGGSLAASSGVLRSERREQGNKSVAAAGFRLSIRYRPIAGLIRLLCCRLCGADASHGGGSMHGFVVL